MHKDQLVHGMWRTRGRALELGAHGVEPFYETMELWASLGVSFIAEQTFYRGVSEPDVARRLAPNCVLVNVHCQSTHAVARFARRMRDDPLCGEARLRKLMPLAERLQSELYEPLAFGMPAHRRGHRRRLHARAANVIDQIDQIYSPPRIHDLDRPASPG